MKISINALVEGVEKKFEYSFSTLVPLPKEDIETLKEFGRTITFLEANRERNIQELEVVAYIMLSTTPIEFEGSIDEKIARCRKVHEHYAARSSKEMFEKALKPTESKWQIERLERFGNE